MANFEWIKFFADGTLYHSLLRKHFFIIPDYQRDYSWTKKNIEELLFDLDNSHKERKSHFVWAIVLSWSKDDENINVIDWQQRLISISLITSVICKMTTELNLDKDLKIKQKELINACKYSLSKEVRSKRKNIIDISRNSNTFYWNLINNIENNNTNLREEEKLLEKNYNVIYKHIKSNIDRFSDTLLKLEFLETMLAVIENISIIPIYVNNEYDAYTIFEVLNDRWLELNIADLLKNLVFKKTSTENKEKIKKIWEEMLIILENSKINITQFLRHYWISKESFVREKELYESIKDKIKSYDDQDLIDFLNDLLNNTKNYKKVYFPDLENFKWVDKWKNIFVTLNYIDMFKVKQCYPIILTLYNKFIKDELTGIKLYEYLSKIEKFSFLYIKTDLSPSKIEWYYSDYSIKIFKSNKNGIDNIFNELIWKLKDELKSIDLKKIYDNLVYEKDWNNKLINYVLQRLELEDNIEFSVDWNTIEHILSKSDSSILKFCQLNGLSNDESIHYINKIWNLTLLTWDDNEKLDNKDDFIEKKLVYSRSRILITRDLFKNKNWWKDEIDLRHDILFKKFSKIWKI